MGCREEKARLNGMEYALKIAKEQGIDALAEDIKRRGGHGIPVGLDRQAEREFVDRVKMNILDTVLVLSCATLQDEFGFGKKRTQKFIDRFNFKANCLSDDYVLWEEIQEGLKDELGIDLKIRWNK